MNKNIKWCCTFKKIQHNQEIRLKWLQIRLVHISYQSCSEAYLWVLLPNEAWMHRQIDTETQWFQHTPPPHFVIYKNITNDLQPYSIQAASALALTGKMFSSPPSGQFPVANIQITIISLTHMSIQDHFIYHSCNTSMQKEPGKTHISYFTRYMKLKQHTMIIMTFF